MERVIEGSAPERAGFGFQLMRQVPHWPAVVARVSEAISNAFPPGSSLPMGVEELAWHVASAQTAWPLAVDYDAGSCDRRGDLLSAPLYTSEKNPWPRQDGKWCEPILQIDLAAWGALADINVGQGLLQVWEPQTAGLIRVLPVEALAGAPSPIPSGNHEDFHDSLGDWDRETGRANWRDRAGRITGFGEPFFDAAGYHLRRDLQSLIEGEQETGKFVLTDALGPILAQIGELHPEPRHRAFGMCAGNIFNTADNLPPVLLTIESDDRVFSTIGSTLCICYEQKPEGFVYSAHLFSE